MNRPSAKPGGDSSGLGLSSRIQSLRAAFSRREAWVDLHDGLPGVWLVLFYVLALLLCYSRAPHLFVHPAFYAEDGAVWFADAYNLGWLHSLTLPDGGYLNTLQRLGAGPALLVPFAHAPLVMMLIGLLVEALPVPILLSARCRDWGPLSVRAFFALIYVACPNSREIHVVLTNSQWHLAVSVALLAFACAPRGWPGRAVDLAVFLVAGFSGPFAIIVLPLTVLFWWVRRQSWTLVVLAAMGVGVLTQVYLLIHHHGDRIDLPLGATPALFARMLAGDVLLAGVFGAHPWSSWLPVPALLVVAAAGLAIYGYCMVRGPVGLKLFVLFCLLLLPPELKTPLISGDRPLWQILADTTSARYWYFPMLSFLWCCVWCAARAQAATFRWAGAAVIVALGVGIASDWRFQRFKDVGFEQSARRFEQARHGERVVMMVMPKTDPAIVMKLDKK